MLIKVVPVNHRHYCAENGKTVGSSNSFPFLSFSTTQFFLPLFFWLIFDFFVYVILQAIWTSSSLLLSLLCFWCVCTLFRRWSSALTPPLCWSTAKYCVAWQNLRVHPSFLYVVVVLDHPILYLSSHFLFHIPFCVCARSFLYVLSVPRCLPCRQLSLGVLGMQACRALPAARNTLASIPHFRWITSFASMRPILTCDVLQRCGWKVIARLGGMYSSSGTTITLWDPERRDGAYGLVMVCPCGVVFRLVLIRHS